MTSYIIYVAKCRNQSMKSHSEEHTRLILYDKHIF